MRQGPGVKPAVLQRALEQGLVEAAPHGELVLGRGLVGRGEMVPPAGDRGQPGSQQGHLVSGDGEVEAAEVEGGLPRRRTGKDVEEERGGERQG